MPGLPDGVSLFFRFAHKYAYLTAQDKANIAEKKILKPEDVVFAPGVDTAAGVVHLNDSGSEDGRDERVPIDVFVRSWDTSDDQMTVTA